jgi:glutathione synthase/RimK-type ligase-like ATP-grasp enzyme
MRVGICDIKDPNGESLVVHQIYETILSYNDISSMRLHIEQPDFWNQVRGLSLFIMRLGHLPSHLQQARDILPIVERDYGIPCYPNQATSWHYDDKVKQHFLMKAHGFPIIDSWTFYDRKAALEWAARIEDPVVFKLRGGAGSMNVVLVKTPRQAARLIRRMFGRGILPERFFSTGAVRFKHFNLYQELHHMGGNLYRWSKGLDTSPFWETQKNYVLFQRFLPDNDCDTRITVIGNRAFAFRRMVRHADFRASGSGRIDYDMSRIDMRCVELAFKVSQQMGFQSMAYDFLMNESREPEFCEISYAYVSSAVHSCPGYWDTGLDWHEGHFWPEHLHLVDALGIPDLKVPELDY